MRSDLCDYDIHTFCWKKCQGGFYYGSLSTLRERSRYTDKSEQFLTSKFAIGGFCLLLFACDYLISSFLTDRPLIN